MKYLNFVCIGLITISLGLNIYQWQYFSNYQSIIANKDALIANGYDEMIISYLKENREINNEIIKNQGRIEGILSVVNNYKPEENQHAAIWHSGYYNGLEQKNYQIEDSVKITKDIKDKK